MAKDVCGILGHARPTDATKYLDDDEKGVDTIHTLGGDQQMVVINESGLYSLILRSRKPEQSRHAEGVWGRQREASRTLAGAGRHQETHEGLP